MGENWLDQASEEERKVALPVSCVGSDVVSLDALAGVVDVASSHSSFLMLDPAEVVLVGVIRAVFPEPGCPGEAITEGLLVKRAD